MAVYTEAQRELAEWISSNCWTVFKLPMAPAVLKSLAGDVAYGWLSNNLTEVDHIEYLDCPHRRPSS